MQEAVETVAAVDKCIENVRAWAQNGTKDFVFQALNSAISRMYNELEQINLP